MALKVANENKFRIIPSKAEVRLADDRVVKIFGKTEKLSVEIRGHRCSLSFMILDHKDYDVLLGLDFFNENLIFSMRFQ